MNIFENSKFPGTFSFLGQTAIALILAILFWAVGAPLLLLNKADAAQLTAVSDTLYDSDLGVGSKHAIQYTTATSTIQGQTIVIQFDPVGHLFSQAFTGSTTTVITASGMTVVTTCGGGGDEVVPTGNYNNGTNENITFTVCTGDVVTAGTKIINIGSTSTPIITNPSSAGSYRILIGGTWDDDGETRVAIIDDVVVTASVNTSFTFTIAGLATSTSVNGEVTTGSTTATVMAFNTLVPGGTNIMGQELTVTTNAANGFVVTVREDQNLLSSTGADIDLFSNGATTSDPIAWVAPSNTLGQEWTYGHMGVTSEDSDLTLGGGAFAANEYAGNFDTPRPVFSHNGPSNGLVANSGVTQVAFRIEIASLQEAAIDYTNTLTYVATPTF